MNKMRISTKWEKFSEDISSDFAEIKRIVKEYYEQLYSNKSDNLSEMRQMFVMRVKEKEAELKEAEKEVSHLSLRPGETQTRQAFMLL